MAKNKHPKRVLANKMVSRQERRDGTPVFDSKAWEKRKTARTEKESSRRKI